MSDWERIEFWCSKASVGKAIYGPVLERVRDQQEQLEKDRAGFQAEAEAQQARFFAELERAEKLDDALREIADILDGWTRPMTDGESLRAIKTIAEKALRKE